MFASLQFPVQGLLRDRAWIRAQQFQHRFLQNPGTDLDRRLRETGVSIRREKDLFNGSAFFSGADQEDLVVIKRRSEVEECSAPDFEVIRYRRWFVIASKSESSQHDKGKQESEPKHVGMVARFMLAA
jgi:hypothetical protein